MKKIILILPASIILSCGTREKKASLEVTKSISKINTEKEVFSDIKSDKKEAEFIKNINGNLSFKIIPSNHSHKDTIGTYTKTSTTRKFKIKDSFGNTSEYDLKGDETVLFGSENTQSESLRNLEEKYSILEKEKSKLTNELNSYKKNKDKYVKSSRVHFIVYFIIYLLGLISIPLFKKIIKR